MAILGFTKNVGEDWFTSSQYSTKEIQNIPDPEGGHATNAPTAIPSPFARMDMVRKSFENIAESPFLAYYQHGKTVVASKEDERIVSQCLDLAELLFFYENYKDKLEILTWNKTEHINKLNRSQTEGHRKLGDVLSMYLRQDADAFNFNSLKSIYIIKYNFEVIGGTSPLTLFFNAVIDSSKINATSTKGKVFFKDVVPLYQRDEEFQKYIQLLFKANPILIDKMPAFKNYIDKSLELVGKNDQELYKTLNTVNIAYLKTNYDNLNTKNAGEVVEVFSVPLKTIDSSKIPIEESDFVIFSRKANATLKPLVLQNNFNKAYKYINAPWDDLTKVPYLDTNVLQERTLPGLNIKSPYITTSDFLEDVIIRLVYPIDSKHYFDGNLKPALTDFTKSYLLPLKPLFFEYFDVEELLHGTAGEPTILIEEIGIKEGVRVLLKIPIKSGEDYISFERIYYNESRPDAKNNKGAIMQQEFGITILPLIKTNKNIDASYTIQLIDRNLISNNFNIDYQLSFFCNSDKKPIEISREATRTKKVKGDVTKSTTKYYRVAKAFDYILVDSKFGKGIIIPKWKTYEPTGDQFTFAVDFGTTNTHIEYAVNGSAPIPFEITENDIQAVSLFSEETEHNFSSTGAIDIRNVVLKEFVPKEIKNNGRFNFPVRTVISQSKIQTQEKGGNGLIEFNIPFTFEKEIDNFNKHFTNLKWDNKEPNNESRVRAFLEQLVIMMRNKVLMQGGDLNATKIVWTYPVSMSSYKKDNLSKTWDELFVKYISKNGKTESLSESLAPYYYFKSKNILDGMGFGNSILIDIGGGTSDVVAFNDHKPVLVSSYKFAGNAVFGDGYSELGNLANNKLAKKYKGEFDKLLQQSYAGMKSMMEGIYKSDKTSDFNTFLFSFEHNNEIKDKSLFDYNAMLSKNEDLRIVFLYFYAAKVYHIAKLLQINNLNLPSNLIFSGNGSKILKIISVNEKTISGFTQEIFKLVFNIKEYPAHGLKITVEKEIPKPVTSKGTIIHARNKNEDLDLSDIRTALTCMEDAGKSVLTYGDLEQNLVQERIVSEVENFNSLFMELLDDFDCESKFGLTYHSISVFKDVSNKHIREFLKAGILFNQMMEGIAFKETAVVNETLFFYPLIETIQQLIDALIVDEAEV